ncbi:hypothetical protein OAF54_01685 [bacterium]|nr:hypothetical protein [bacterium]
MAKKMYSIRLDQELVKRIDKQSEFKGQRTKHIERAMEQYVKRLEAKNK